MLYCALLLILKRSAQLSKKIKKQTQWRGGWEQGGGRRKNDEKIRGTGKKEAKNGENVGRRMGRKGKGWVLQKA